MPEIDRNKESSFLSDCPTMAECLKNGGNSHLKKVSAFMSEWRQDVDRLLRLLLSSLLISKGCLFVCLVMIPPMVNRIRICWEGGSV